MTADSEAVAAGDQSTASHPRITENTTPVVNEYEKREMYTGAAFMWKPWILIASAGLTFQTNFQAQICLEHTETNVWLCLAGCHCVISLMCARVDTVL